MDYRRAPNIRHAEIHHGDDIKRVALRETGSAEGWTELVLLNELRPPYIAEAPARGVLAYGDMIKVPAPNSRISADSDAVGVFKVDVLVSKGALTDDGHGDLSVVSGVANLVQALTHHVVVEKQELAFHPEFGCWVRSMIGKASGPRAGRMAAFFVRSAILEDRRVRLVQSCEASVAGDTIHVSARVVPISGAPADLEVII